MNSIISSELFQCPIDYTPFVADDPRQLMILKCGHSVCSTCLKNNNTFRCCGKEQDVMGENEIISKILNIIYAVDINYSFLTNLEFYFCETCKYFISNKSYDYHNANSHNIKTIAQFNVENLGDLINKINQPDKFSKHDILYFVILTFHNMDIIKVRFNNLKDIVYVNKKKFTFYGETIEESEIKKSDQLTFIKEMMKQYNERNENYKTVLRRNRFKIKKGYLLGKDYQLINGYFLFIDDKTVKRAFGILNFKLCQFFGFMTLFDELIEANNCFSFDCGIFDEGNSIYIGKFVNHEYIINAYPGYDFEQGEIFINDENIFRQKNKNNKKLISILRSENYHFENNSLIFQDNKNYKIEILYEENFSEIKEYNIHQMTDNHTIELPDNINLNNYEEFNNENNAEENKIQNYIKDIKIVTREKSKLVFENKHLYENDFYFNNTKLITNFDSKNMYFIFSEKPLDIDQNFDIENIQDLIYDTDFYLISYKNKYKQRVMDFTKNINLDIPLITIRTNPDLIFDYFNILFFLPKRYFIFTTNKDNNYQKFSNIVPKYMKIKEYFDIIANKEVPEKYRRYMKEDGKCSGLCIII